MSIKSILNVKETVDLDLGGKFKVSLSVPSMKDYQVQVSKSKLEEDEASGVSAILAHFTTSITVVDEGSVEATTDKKEISQFYDSLAVKTVLNVLEHFLNVVNKSYNSFEVKELEKK